jgi:hypothetical protein
MERNDNKIRAMSTALGEVMYEDFWLIWEMVLDIRI